LVDDGSPDNCGKICDDYAKKDARITVIHRENGGLSVARNTGIDRMFSDEKCMSEYITFIDSDDIVLPRYLEYMLKAMCENDVDISTCTSIVTRSREVCVSDEYGVSLMTPEEYWVFGNGGLTVAWAKLYKTALFENIRFPEGRIHEDEATTYKLLFSVDKIAVCTTQLYAYFLSEGSIMRSPWNEKTFDKQFGHQEQLLYFKRHGFKKALKTSKRLYLGSIIAQLKTFKKDRKAHKEHKKYLYKIINDFQKEYFKCPLLRCLPSKIYVLHLITVKKIKDRMNGLKVRLQRVCPCKK